MSPSRTLTWSRYLAHGVAAEQTMSFAPEMRNCEFVQMCVCFRSSAPNWQYLNTGESARDRQVGARTIRETRSSHDTWTRFRPSSSAASVQGL